MVDCRTCNREVAGLNLGRGYFAPRSTQPSIPPAGKAKAGIWLIPLAHETQGVQVKLCYHLTMRAMPERLRDVSCRRYTNRPYNYLLPSQNVLPLSADNTNDCLARNKECSSASNSNFTCTTLCFANAVSLPYG